MCSREFPQRRRVHSDNVFAFVRVRFHNFVAFVFTMSSRAQRNYARSRAPCFSWTMLRARLRVIPLRTRRYCENAHDDIVKIERDNIANKRANAHDDIAKMHVTRCRRVHVDNCGDIANMHTNACDDIAKMHTKAHEACGDNTKTNANMRNAKTHMERVHVYVMPSRSSISPNVTLSRPSP